MKIEKPDDLLNKARQYTMTGQLSISFDDLVLELIERIESLQKRLDEKIDNRLGYL